jgi:DnaJ family protein B protein 12
VLLQRLDYLRGQPARDAAKSKEAAAPKPVERNTQQTETRAYSEEDAKVCREIIAQKDYYKVLGVERNCTEAELKKAFKKRAIKVHPDKNPAPRATDAFKKVNAAMACLSDKDKRRVYDQVGSEAAYE